MKIGPSAVVFTFSTLKQNVLIAKLFSSQSLAFMENFRKCVFILHFDNGCQ